MQNQYHRQVTPVANRRSALGPGWVLFTALFAAQAAILVLSPILPALSEEFAVSTSAAAQLRSVSAITAGVIALALAAFGKRLGLLTLVKSGLTLLAICSLLSALAPTFAVLVITHLGLGFGLAAVLSGGMAASEAWAAPGERNRVLSLALIGQPVAWVVGQPIAGLVAAQSWRWAWIAVPLLAAVAGLATVALRDRSMSDVGRDCDPAGLLKQPGMKGWATSELLAFTAWGGALVFAGALYIEQFGVSVGLTGVILGVGAAMYLPGNWLARRMVERGSRILLVGSSTGAAVMVTLFYTAGGLPLGVSVAGFGAAVFFAGARTMAGAALGLELADGRRLAAMSVRTGASQFGYLLGAAAGGLLLSIGGYGAMGWGLGAIFALSGVVHIPRLISGGFTLEGAGRYLRRSPVVKA